MRNILLLLVVLYFCKSSVAQLKGTVQQVTFTGAETKKSISFSIYLPPGYASALSKKYPVVYHTHGANQTHNGAHTADVALAFETASSLGHWDEGIIVFPDGYLNTMWADSYDGTKPAETNVVREIIPYVDATYRTIPDKQHRFIQGFSVGGFGALKFFTKYPDLFCKVALYDASLPDWNGLKSMYPAVASSIFNNDSTYFNKFSPWYFLDKVKTQLSQDTLIDINVGVLSSYATRLKDKLNGYHVPCTYSLTGCQHDVGCLTRAQGDSTALFFYRSLKQLPTATNKLKQQNKSVWPDHSRDKLVINLDEGEMEVAIYNLQGQVVLIKQLKNTNELNIRELRTGIYILGIRTRNSSYSAKFVKQPRYK